MSAFEQYLIAQNRARLARVRVSGALLVDLFQTGPHDRAQYRVVRNGLPEDAEIVAANYSDGVLTLWIHSDDFAPVPHDRPVPLLRPVFETNLEKRSSDASVPDSPPALPLTDALSAWVLEKALETLDAVGYLFESSPDLTPDRTWDALA